MLNKQINRQWLQRLVGSEADKQEDCGQKLHTVWRDQLSRKRRALIPVPVTTDSGLGKKFRVGSLKSQILR